MMHGYDPLSEFRSPTSWPQMTEEERMAGCGRELLSTLRELFDSFGLGAGFDFDTPGGRRAAAGADAACG